MRYQACFPAAFSAVAGFWAAGVLAAVVVSLFASAASGKSLKAPPGLFKDINDKIVGDAIIIRGKQLFIDDYIIGTLRGVKKVLNQPTKHPKNPLLVPDKPWEGRLGFSSVMYDKEEGFYKMWYGSYSVKTKRQALCYSTSPDGIKWRKHLTTAWSSKEHSNIVFGRTPEFNCAGVFKDPNDVDGERRYKMLYSDYPDGTAKTASSSAAYSPDGVFWKPYAENPLIPFSDSHCCPFWDPQRKRYVAYLRYGPPNTRAISMIESEDFINWSPKITLFWQLAAKMDRPFSTKLYQMEVMQYEGVYIGFVSTYHGETIKTIPKDKESWMDKTDVQIAFSRNGRTWSRVGKGGAMTAADHRKKRDWKAFSRAATFLPWGKHGKEWDWGAIYVLQAPMVRGDEIRIYYSGRTNRHWASYHGDKDTKTGIGLATLRLDGFVSVDAAAAGTMTTKKFVFVGDTLEVNANAKGGSITVEALGADGKVIEGFTRKDCVPIKTDSVRHVLSWKGQKDSHLIQARPIKLRFYLRKAKLYSFTPRNLNKHYVPSYD